MEYDKNIEKKETSEIMEKSDKKIEEKETNNVIVIDFMAEWCGPCKMQDPVIEEMKKKFEGKVTFKKIDIDTNGELANKYNIMAVPTLIIEKNGNVFKKLVGLTRSKELEKTINDAIDYIHN
jgi:thioredoxin 1